MVSGCSARDGSLAGVRVAVKVRAVGDGWWGAGGVGEDDEGGGFGDLFGEGVVKDLGC